MSSTTAGRTPTANIQDTQFWNELMHDVYGPRKGGAIIFVDAENARKGVAKTSGATALARLLSTAFSYDLQKDDLTLSGKEYLQRYRDHPGQEQPSVLVLDEIVGAGAGDKRRSMAEQNVDFGRAWQLLRTKRVITLATVPDWNQVDKRLKKLADYRIWCRERPMGTFQAYKIVVPFNTGSGGTVHTKGMGPGSETRRIQFPNMDAQNDPYYRHISKKKDELIGSDTWDADVLAEDEGEEVTDPDEVARLEAIKVAIRMVKPWDDDAGSTYKEVGRAVGYSHGWVGNRIAEWKEGDHRDLVPSPEADDD